MAELPHCGSASAGSGSKPDRTESACAARLTDTNIVFQRVYPRPPAAAGRAGQRAGAVGESVIWISTSGRGRTDARNASAGFADAHAAGLTRRMSTGRPSRPWAARAISARSSRSAVPTTSTSTSCGIGPGSPR